MTTTEPLRITAALRLPREEIIMRASRSSGPGGQHVNTSSTRIELTWDIAASEVLSDAQRARLLEQLAPRLAGGSVLRIVAQEERSQLRNREAALARLQQIVAAALVVPRPRRATRPTAASRERRLKDKKARSERKRDRQRRDDD